MSKHKHHPALAITGLLWLSLAAPALAQTAGMLSFQGLLKDADGVPVNGPVTLQFRIYDAQTGGNLMDIDGNGAVEDITGKDAKEVSTTATNGLVSTKFGPMTANAFEGARWLEVHVRPGVTGTFTTLSRTEIATSPATSERITPFGTSYPFLFASPREDAMWMTGSAGWLGFFRNWLGRGTVGLVCNRRDNGYSNGLAIDTLCLTVFNNLDPPGTGRPSSLVVQGGTDSATVGKVTLSAGLASDSGAALTVQNYYTHTTITSSRISVPVVEIRGGSDLAEPFAVVSSRNVPETIEPGMVVVIDPDNPGQLKLAREPYDRKVAGVISGANGLNPGMVMSGLSNDGTHAKAQRREDPVGAVSDRDDAGRAKGSGSETPPTTRPAGTVAEHPVALTGRVYVWADASFGAIEPGDMLTTCSTPGHAMRADEKKDFPRGCVIGKAMSRLEKNRGLVLVLVQPQ